MNFFDKFKPFEFDKLLDGKHVLKIKKNILISIEKGDGKREWKTFRKNTLMRIFVFVVLIFASLLDISVKHEIKQHCYKFIEKICRKEKGILCLYSS